MKVFTVLTLSVAFLMNCTGPMPASRADDFVLPQPGHRVPLSPAFDPPMLKGIKVFPNDPLRMDFIMDQGDSNLSGDALKKMSIVQIQYFMASLTVPKQDLWVNLSPYEKNKIIPDRFAQTQMGRDLLAEDYILKQITSSLIYPEDATGKKFWSRVYTLAARKYGTTDIPVNTFNKVWILPQKAVVYENADAGTAYVVDSKLKVMLEEDYLSQAKHENVAQNGDSPLENNDKGTVPILKDSRVKPAYVGVPEGGKTRASSFSAPLSEAFRERNGETRGQDPNIRVLGTQIIREIVLPQLTAEINRHKNFARLRQIYNALILADWYKKKVIKSLLSEIYVGKNKIKGINTQDIGQKNKIYRQYLQAFKKGVYNYIKEEKDPLNQQTVSRRYFAGGADLQELKTEETSQMPRISEINRAMIIESRVDAKRDKAEIAYIDDVLKRGREGQPLTLTAVFPYASEAQDWTVRLHSNLHGLWQTERIQPQIQMTGGHAQVNFQVQVPKHNFRYTFELTRNSDGYREWADLPYGNGRVWVDRKFEGTYVSVGMEFRPYVQKGGQADVNYELPRELVRKGIKSIHIMPLFKKLERQYQDKEQKGLEGYHFQDTGIEITVPFKHRASVRLRVKSAVYDGITMYFLDAYDTPDLFVEPYLQDEENQTEFYESVLMSRGAVELMKKLDLRPDIVQFSDHQAALTPLYMKELYDDFFAKTGRLFSIHNIGYQGTYKKDFIDELGLDWIDPHRLQRLVIHSGEINMMAIPPGLSLEVHNRGWFVAPVSPTYADEIKNTGFGNANTLFKWMGNHFGGIMNGLDPELYKPNDDPLFQELGIPPFNKDSDMQQVIQAKSKSKDILQSSLGKDAPIPEWESNKNIKKSGYLVKSENPLFGYVGRLSRQKQLDILADILEDIRDGKRESFAFDVVVAGPAEKKGDDLQTMDRLEALADDQTLREKGINLVVLRGFVYEMEKLISLGSSLVLMPSDYEPAGIAQLKAMRMATVPLVRLTGGLKDTVFPSGPNQNGYGFHGQFRSPDPGVDAVVRRQNAHELYDTMRQAYNDYTFHPDHFWSVLHNGMEWVEKYIHEVFLVKMNNGLKFDTSWTRPAQDYINVFAWLKDELDGDEAMLDEPPNLDEKGGIDLTSDDGFSVQNSGRSLDLHVDAALLSRLRNADVFVPVVVKIRALKDFSGFLGVHAMPRPQRTYENAKMP